MSQNETILEYLQKGHTLTQAEAIALFGCYRLGARIYEIRELGFDIRKNMVEAKNRFGDNVRFARYWMAGGKHD